MFGAPRLGRGASLLTTSFTGAASRARRLAMFLGLVVALLAGRPATGAAADGTGVPADQDAIAGRPGGGAFGFGVQQIGAVIAPGFAIPVGGTDSPELRDVRYVFFAPHWGIQLTDPIGRSWYRGTVETLIDAQVMVQVKPWAGIGGGPLALLRYNFISAVPVVPFVDAGAGIMGTHFDLKDRPDGLDFSWEVGVGLHYFVTESVALNVTARFHHVSNAYTKSENLGINSIQLELGVARFFR